MSHAALFGLPMCKNVKLIPSNIKVQVMFLILPFDFSTVGCEDATVLFKALGPVLFTDVFLLAKGRLETVVVAGVAAGLLMLEEGPTVLGFLLAFPKSSALRLLTPPTLEVGALMLPGGASLEGRAIPLLGIPLIFEEIQPHVFY